ncbi:MAG: diaminopimelate epimerase, partial [Christensenella sp.]
DWSAAAKKLCERRISVGADGLLVAEPSDVADVKMRIINADGSEAEMCGNGIRCFARYVYDRGIVSNKTMSIETLAGVMKPVLIMRGGEVEAVRVDMGKPSFIPSEIPILTAEPLDFEVAGLRGACVLMGVPHTMILVESLADTDVDGLGARIEKAEIFPRKTNVNFVEIIDRQNVRMCTWERGAGRTLACGTGATGVGVMLYKKGLAESETDVHVAKGSLHIENAADGRAYMTGAAEYVFEGEVRV